MKMWFCVWNDYVKELVKVKMLKYDNVKMCKCDYVKTLT